MELLAQVSASTSALKSSQVVVLPSACNSVAPHVAAAAPSGMLAPEFGIHWPTPSQLHLSLPAHPGFTPHGPPPLDMLRGGELGWVLGPGRVSNWYDHPLAITVEPELQADVDVPVTRAMLVVRPRMEAISVDDVHLIAFRKAYPGRECELVYTHTRWVGVESP